MKKILITLLMPFFLVNLSFATLFDALIPKRIPKEELYQQYQKERERKRQEKLEYMERKKLEGLKKYDYANMAYTPKDKKELIALLKKPNIPLENIDVSEIKDLSYLFDETYGREDLSGIEKWNVKAKKMRFMFSSPFITKLPQWYLDFILKHPTYTPQSKEELERIISDDRVNLAEIDVSNIKDFSKLFYHSSRTLVGLEYWDMSGAENLNGMFELFGGEIVGDLSKWNLSNAKSMKNIFVGSNVESYPKWYVEFAKKHPSYQPKSKEELRKILKEYENVWVGSGKVGGVKVRYMALPLIEIDVSGIKDLSYVFCSSKRIEKCVSRVEDFRGIEYWDVSGVENLNRAFMGSKINIDLKKWSVKNVKDFYEAFAETPYSWDLSDWEVSEGANVERVFFDSALEREDRLPKVGTVGGRMIAFAKLLSERYPRVWERIEEVLVGQGIGYALIEGCKDIWVRDFMPLRLKDGKFLSYEYMPNYLSSYPHLRTRCPRGDVELGLVLDGGNFVRFGKRAMMCEKIFSENPSLSRDEVISRVKERAGIEELIVLPKVAYDRYGHSDGMARWISGDEILINDFSNESEKFLASLSQALRGYRVRSLKYSEGFWKQYSWGVYLNFVEIENILLLPTYGIPEDKRVVERFEEIFENKLVIPIECKEIIKRGGALHCVSAEVKGVTQPVIKAL